MQIDQCFCGQGKTFADCCQPLLRGERIALNPKELMASRFSAFCTRDADYLLQTLHPAFYQADERQLLQQNFAQYRWHALQILAESRPDAMRGEVEFVAWFSDSEGRPGQLHERSRFVQQDGRWFYTDGDALPPVQLGRNDPCWCGSGKKLKKCHPQ